MTKSFKFSAMRGLLLLALTLLALAAHADSALALQEIYAALQAPLSQNQFKRALVLESTDSPDGMRGDVYGVLDYPFGTVSSGLNSPSHWCDVLILHINTKYCHPVAGPDGTRLRIYIGKKTPESLATAMRIDLDYSVVALAPDYFEIVLHAKDGPQGTSDFHISLTGIAAQNNQTFLHLTYRYATNWFARLAMQTYLGTVGYGKVGFTPIGPQANGQPELVAGVRGLVERNTMRYYLAIDSFLAATHNAPAQQLENRLQHWFGAAEQYPQQLHDMARPEYLEMKRSEHERQQTAQ